MLAVKKCSLAILACAWAVTINARAAAPAPPADLNLASMRLTALDTCYEFDFSIDQLKILKAVSAKTAAIRARTPAKPNALLAEAFSTFQTALLAGDDDESVSKLRSQIAELAADAELDDAVEPTDASLAAAASFCKQIKASQIAAFVMLHADEIVDPGEFLAGALVEIRDNRDEPTTTPAETAAMIKEAAQSASFLVCGSDSAKSKELESQITTWLKTNVELPEKDFTALAATREPAIKKLLGDVDPIVVLGHWVGLQIAQLISNPELPAAIDASIAAQAAAK